MGSFSRTCAVSALPIESGDKIRVVLLNQSPYGEDSWSLRSVPFRATYDDYGGVEGFEDAGIHARLTMAQFKRDLVERPWGNNLCHDVPIGPTTTLENLFSAIGTETGRVQARCRESKFRPTPKVKVPKGIPTWRRVAKRLNAAGIKGFTTNRVAYGMVRVRATEYENRKPAWHESVRAVLEPYYRVQERYEYGPSYHKELSEDSKGFDVWLLVLPRDEHGEWLSEGVWRELPPINPHHAKRTERLLYAIENSHGELPFKCRPLVVGWAMIREDVWQAMLKLGGKKYGWEKTDTVKSHITRGRHALKKARIYLKDHYSFLERLKKLSPDERTHFESTRETPEESIDYVIAQEWNLRSLPSVSGLDYAFAHLTVLSDEKKASEQEVETIIQDLSELFVVQDIMFLTCRQWRPTYSGPQSGIWNLQTKVLESLAAVAKTRNDEREALYAKYR